jgi:hypothetical protein
LKIEQTPQASFTIRNLCFSYKLISSRFGPNFCRVIVSYVFFNAQKDAEVSAKNENKLATNPL